MKKILLGILLSLLLVYPVDAATEKKVKVSSNDSTAGFLNGKLVAGTNVTFNEGDDGANETLTINATGGGGGSAIILDLADDSSNESTDIGEIATSGDTNSIFTEPTDDKLLIDLSNDWPKADDADEVTCTGCVADGELATDFISEAELSDEAELEAQLTDVTNVFTNNDGNLTADDLSDNSIDDLGTQDHDLLDGLSDDDHTQYALLAGRATGQTIIGGTGSGDDITLQTTSDITKGSYIFSELTNCDTIDTDGSGILTCGTDATGAGGSAIILDLADDASNESVDLVEIATTGDTNNIFTEPSADKLLIDVSNNWPTADTANAGDSATSFFSSGTLEHEVGGLEADVNAFTGLLAISGGATSEVDAKSELETQIADVSDFAEADGDTYTGTHNFGGATIEIENDASAAVANAGEVALDTTAGDLLAHDGTSTRVYTWEYSRSTILEGPDDADRYLIWRAPYNATVTDIDCIVDPADTTESAVIALYESDASGDFTSLAANGLDGATTITCDNDGAADDGTLSNGTVDSGDHIGIDVGTVTGTVSTLTVTWSFTKDAE